MRRNELEHIIRAASDVTGEQDIVIIGSQAVLGQFPNAPQALLDSIEADVFPRHRPERSIEIDGAIGERSTFHETYGYYAHGVAEDTAVLPRDWQDRLVPVKTDNTGKGIGWCLEVHDLAASKLAAGRQKDLEFVGTLVSQGLVQPEILSKRIKDMDVDKTRRMLIEGRIASLKSPGY